jgi:hypothetical protein
MRFIYLYASLLSLQLWAIAQRETINRASYFEYFIRPLILLSLWVYFWQNSKKTNKPKQRAYTLTALALYWVGEIGLTIGDQVVVVALSYMTAHAFYIAAFSQDNPFRNAFKSNKFIIVIFWGFVVFLFSSFYLLPLPLSLRLPMIAFLMMGACWFMAAFNRVGFVPRASEQWVLVGVICFLCANCLYALNRFSEPFFLYNFIIQVLIAGAHYLIVEGILKNQKT